MQYRHWLFAGLMAQAGVVQAVGLDSSLNAPAHTDRNISTIGQETLPNNIADIKAAIARLEQEKRDILQFQQELKNEIAQLQKQIVANEAVASETVANETAAIQSHAKNEHQAAASGRLAEIRMHDLLAIKEAADILPVDGSHAVATAQNLLGTAPVFSRTLNSNSGTNLWYLLAMIPLGLLMLLMAVRSHRVQQLRRSDQVKDEKLHDRVFGSSRDRSRVESTDQLQKTLSQIREKADRHGRQQLQEQAADAIEARDNLQQMVELYLLYSQYQKALTVILTEITKQPGNADLRLYLMRVYAEMGDWHAFAEQEDVLRRLGQQALLEQAGQLRMQKQAS